MFPTAKAVFGSRPVSSSFLGRCQATHQGHSSTDLASGCGRRSACHGPGSWDIKRPRGPNESRAGLLRPRSGELRAAPMEGSSSRDPVLGRPGGQPPLPGWSSAPGYRGAVSPGSTPRGWRPGVVGVGSGLAMGRVSGSGASGARGLVAPHRRTVSHAPGWVVAQERTTLKRERGGSGSEAG